jgi:hypothetical protein
VLLVQGMAHVQFEDRAGSLRPGDYLNIPAHQRHRVDWTSPNEPTIWLAMFYKWMEAYSGLCEGRPVKGPAHILRESCMVQSKSAHSQQRVTFDTSVRVRTLDHLEWSQKELARQSKLSYHTVRRALKEGRCWQGELEQIDAALGGAGSLAILRRCFWELQWLREVTGLLTLLKKECEWDRVRLYAFEPRGLLFRGVAELGGVSDDFRRLHLSAVSDLLSALLISKQSGALFYERCQSPSRLTISYAAPVDTSLTPLPRNALSRVLFPQDYSGLGRSTLTRWIDFLLTANGRIIGKVTADCCYSDQPWFVRKAMAPTEDVWGILDELSNAVAEPPPRASDSQPTESSCWKALQFLVLQDQLRTLLIALRSDPLFGSAFDRARLYLHHTVWNDLFADLAKETGWGSVKAGTVLRGFVEVGGVESVFTDTVLTKSEDPCTDIFLGSDLSKTRIPIQRAMREGSPVVFTRGNEELGGILKRCKVDHFHNAEEVGRRLPKRKEGSDNQYIGSHLDLPLIDRKQIVLGKVSLDARWHECTHIPTFSDAIPGQGSEAEVVERLKYHAQRMADVIIAATKLPQVTEELYRALNAAALQWP